MGKRFEILSLLSIAAAVGVCYGGSLGIFFFGEIYYAFQNFLYADDSHILTGGSGYGFRPLRGLLYYGLFNTFGLNPLPFHLVHVFLHYLNSVLVFYIVARFTENRVIGLFTALLFATSWLNCQAVCSPAVLHEVLWPFFGLLTVVCFYQFRHKGGFLYYSLSLLCLLLALGSKENAFVLPGVLLLVDWYYRGVEWSPRGILLDLRDGLRRGPVLALLPFFILALIHVFILRYSSLILDAAFGGGAQFQELATIERVISGLRYNMGCLFGVPIIVRRSYIVKFGIVLLILTTLVYFLSPEQEKRRITLLMTCILILVLPVSFLLVSVHYIYLPSVGSLATLVLVFYKGSQMLGERFSAPHRRKDVMHGVFFFLCGALLVLNFRFVSNAVGYYKKLGDINRSFIEKLEASFPDPKQLRGSKLMVVNFPRVLPFPWPRYYMAWMIVYDTVDTPLAVHFGRENLPTIIPVNIPLDCGKRYDKLCHLVREPAPQEYDEMVRDKDTRVYFFDSCKGAIREVTGVSYLELEKEVGERPR